MTIRTTLAKANQGLSYVSISLRLVFFEKLFQIAKKKGEKRMKVEQEKVGTLSTTIFTSDKEVARLCHT